MQQHGIVPLELYYTQVEIGGGYTIKPGEDISEALEKFADAHNTFLSVAIAKAKKEIVEAKDEITVRRVSVLLSQLQTAKSRTNNEGLKIDSIETEDGQSLKRLLETGVIKDIVPVQKMSYRVSARLNKTISYAKKVFIGIANASWFHESWAPYGGTADVNQSYTYQTFTSIT